MPSLHWYLVVHRYKRSTESGRWSYMHTTVLNTFLHLVLTNTVNKDLVNYGAEAVKAILASGGTGLGKGEVGAQMLMRSRFATDLIPGV